MASVAQFFGTKAFKRLLAFLLALVFLVGGIFSVHSVLNRFFRNDFPLVFELIEESEAEEVPAKKTLEKFQTQTPSIDVDLNQKCQEGEGFSEEIEEIFETQQSQEDQQVVEVVEVPKKKAPAPKKQPPASIKKYGIVFYPPVQYRKDSQGRLVCIHKNDKPRISIQDKPVHIDMQCCLDPDEIPNPFCHYPRSKYGKLLDDFERKKEKLLRRFHQERGL